MERRHGEAVVNNERTALVAAAAIIKCLFLYGNVSDLKKRNYFLQHTEWQGHVQLHDVISSKHIEKGYQTRYCLGNGWDSHCIRFPPKVNLNVGDEVIITVATRKEREGY